jgi:hypothetical protein
MTNVTQLVTTRKYTRKVRLARITSHALPMPNVMGFSIFSVGMDANERAVNGGVHSRHMLVAPMDDGELFTYAMLYLTHDYGAPVRTTVNGRFGDVSDTIDSIAEELAKLCGGPDAEGYYYTQMAAANIALACLNAVSKATRVNMLGSYLQTSVGLFETEGAVTAFWKCVDRSDTPTYEVDYCASATHTPEQVCRTAFEMMFTRISDGRIPPTVFVDEALRTRRARSLASDFISVQSLAVSQFLATVNDRAPTFWVECDAPEEDEVIELDSLSGACIRVME